MKKLIWITIAAFMLAGCGKGDAERAGEKIDEAVDESKEALEKAGDKIETEAEKVERGAKKAKDKVD